MKPTMQTAAWVLDHVIWLLVRGIHNVDRASCIEKDAMDNIS